MSKNSLRGALLVPVSVDACIINTAVLEHKDSDRVIQRLQPDFTALNLYSSPTRNESQDTSGPPQGVYLHWILPPGLRQALPASSPTSKTEFPPLPDRWLVIRHYGPPSSRSAQAWVVESNYIDSKATTPFPDPAFPDSNSRGQTRIGRSMLLSDWKESSGSSPQSFLPKLDALSQGDMHFLLHQPYCDNVFSFKDDFSDLTTGPADPRLQQGPLSYCVIGWYSGNDPLAGCTSDSDGNQLFQNLLQRLRWDLPFDENKGIANRVICQGMVCGVQWSPITSPISPESDFKVQDLRVAMGFNALDAFTALINSSKPGVVPEKLWEAFHTGLLHKLETSEGYEEIQQDLHQSEFTRQSGGVLWTVSSEGIQPSDTTSSLLGLAPDEAKALDQLNQLQEKLSIQNRLLQRMQWDLYGVWWKIGRAAAENINIGNQAGNNELFLQLDINDFSTDWAGSNAVILIYQKSMSVISAYFYNSVNNDLLKNKAGENLVVELQFSALSLEVQKFILDSLPDGNEENQLDEKENDHTLYLKNQAILAANLPLAPDTGSLINKITSQKTHVNKLQNQFDTAKQALTQLLIKSKIKLKPLNKSPFWSPQDPVVLIAGLKSPSWDRINVKVLHCRFQDQYINSIEILNQKTSLTIEDFAFPRELDFGKLSTTGVGGPIEKQWQEFFLLDAINAASLKSSTKITIPALQNIMANHLPQNFTGRLPMYGLQSWQTQPWFPLLSRWTMQWYSTPFDQWQFDGEQYHLQTSSLPTITQSTFRGRSFFIPQANFVLKGMLTNLLDLNPSLKQEFKDWQTTIDSIDKLDLLSFTLSGFHGYLAQCDREMNRTPHIDNPDEKEVAKAVSNEAALAPLLLSIDSVDRFNSIRHGQFYLEDLQVIDRFGQTVNVIQKDRMDRAPVISQYLSPPTGIDGRPYKVWKDDIDPYRVAQLGPRIVQNSRLEADWLSTDKDLPTPLAFACQSNPIAAWILPNYFNQSLQVFDAKGIYLGELSTLEDEKAERICVWETAPSQSENNWKNCPYLCDMLTFLIGKPSGAYEMLREVIDNALMTKIATSADYSHSLAAVAGRLLGLAKAQWSIELEQPAYMDQSWQKVSAAQYQYNPAEPASFSSYTASTMDSFQFPVQLGNTHLSEDGLVGYFQAEDYSQFYSHYVPASPISGSTHSTYAVPIDSKSFFTLTPLNPGIKPSITTTMLFDPFVKIHAHSDIFPLKNLKFPGMLLKQVQNQISLHLRLGPILTERSMTMPSTVSLLQPSLKGVWSWLDPVKKSTEDESQSYLPEMPLRPVDAKAHFTQQPTEIIEGLLKFSSVFGEVKTQRLGGSPTKSNEPKGNKYEHKYENTGSSEHQARFFTGRSPQSLNADILAQLLEYAMMQRDQEEQEIQRAMKLSLQEKSVKITGDLYQELLKMQSGRSDDSLLQQATNESKKGAGQPSIMPRTQQLKLEAKKYGLECHEIKRLGNCLFEAVWDQLQERGVALGEYKNKIHDYRGLRTVVCAHIIDDLIRGYRSTYRDFLAEDANEYIMKLITDGTWAGELELRALSRIFKMIIVTINSDGINMQGQKGPDIYKPPGVSASAAVITLGYERPVHYQSLRDGLLEGKPLRLTLFKQARVAEADKQPLTQPDIKPQLPPISASISHSSNSSSSFSGGSTGLKKEVSDLSVIERLTFSQTKDKTAPLLITILSQFNRKLASLCEDNHYKFTLERPSRNKLFIRLIADKSIWADSRKIKSQLEPAIDLLRKMVIGANIKTQQFKIQYNSDMGSLTIIAEPAVLERIGSLLEDAGSAYFSNKSKQIKTMLFSEKVEMLRQGFSLLSKTDNSNRDSESIVTCAIQ